jgi:predicted RNase H-like HicB family nuclease
MQYLVIFEKGASSYGAYVPDLPGCVAIGETMEEASGLIAEAIQLHIEGLLKDGLVVPLPTSTVAFIDVATN